MSVCYGGQPAHVPEAKYVGGSIVKYDYVSNNECCLGSLNMWCDSVGISKNRRYYIIVNRGFKLLIDTNDLRGEYKKRFVDREIVIYVDTIEGAESGEGEKD
ncbi:hypothetical protein Salat_1164200, partial [Sesamum alatum]